MEQLENESDSSAKKKFILSLVLLLGGILYTLWPIDIIPDILGPIGWIDDISILLVTFLYAAYSYYRKDRQNKT
ncbi:MAG: YkvA family protein [Spirochaetota bacterium]